jgi:hypothetical protein
VRTKTIIVGAIAALALATLSVNAGNGPHRSAPGSAMSLVAGTSAIEKADRAEVTAAIRTTSTVKTATTTTKAAETAEKPEVEVEDETEAPKGPVSPACQTAIDNLKALRQADVAEDTAEKAAASTTDADKAEDMVEAQHLRDARNAVRTACLPQPSAACQTAIDNLKALRQADVAEDATEKAAPEPTTATAIAAERAEDVAEFQGWKVALMAVRTACGGDRD